MNLFWKRMVVGLTLAAAISTFGLVVGTHVVGPHEKENGIKGWEKSSNYDELYDPAEIAKIKGVVLDIINITPLPGMAPGVGLRVRSPIHGNVTVHLGPRAFLALNYIWNLRGSRVKIRGYWAEIEGEQVFIASKVKNSLYVVKLRRTSDGTPHWTLSQEERARELALE
jgi:hypothetical protein